MSMIFEVQSGGGIPAGIYRAKFLGVTPTTHEEYGVVARFDFEVLDGAQKGEQTSRITSPKPTPRNACGRMIAGLAGRAVEAGQRVNLEPYVGLDYLVQVELAASGTATRVAVVMPGTWAQQGFAAPASPQTTGGISSQNTPSPSQPPTSVPAGVSVLCRLRRNWTRGSDFRTPNGKPSTARKEKTVINVVIVEPPAAPPAAAIPNPLEDLRRRREEAAAELAKARADLAAAADLPARVPMPPGPKIADLAKAGATIGDLLAAIEDLRKARAASVMAVPPQVAAEADARRRIGKTTAYLRDTSDPSLSDEIRQLKQRIAKLEESRLHLGRRVQAADEVDDLTQRLAKWEAGEIDDEDLRFYLQRSHRPLSLLEDLYPSKQLASLPTGATNLRKKIEHRAGELAMSLRGDAIRWLRGELCRRQARLGNVAAVRQRLAVVDGLLADAQEEIRRLREKQLEP